MCSSACGLRKCHTLGACHITRGLSRGRSTKCDFNQVTAEMHIPCVVECCDMSVRNSPRSRACARCCTFAAPRATGLHEEDGISVCTHTRALRVLPPRWDTTRQLQPGVARVNSPAPIAGQTHHRGARDIERRTCRNNMLAAIVPPACATPAVAPWMCTPASRWQPSCT